MRGDEREPRAQALPLASALSIHLDHAEAEQQKRRRAHELHVVRVSAMRLAGFTALLLLIHLHNRFALGSFSWDAYIGLSVVLLGWALLAGFCSPFFTSDWEPASHSRSCSATSRCSRW